MIEMLHAAEVIKELLHDDDLLQGELIVQGERQMDGVGVIEAPRVTLFHHYRVDENDVVTMANLIVSTTNNNQAMNEAIRHVARRYLHGREVTEGLLNHIEVAIRAFATMPSGRNFAPAWKSGWRAKACPGVSS